MVFSDWKGSTEQSQDCWSWYNSTFTYDLVKDVEMLQDEDMIVIADPKVTVYVSFYVTDSQCPIHV